MIWPKHYTRLDNYGNTESYPWDCEGELITLVFSVRDRSESHLDKFHWKRTCFEEIDGVVLKINGEVVDAPDVD